MPIHIIANKIQKFGLFGINQANWINKRGDFCHFLKMENSIVAAKAEYNTQKSSFTTLLRPNKVIKNSRKSIGCIHLVFPDTVNRNIIHFYFCLDGTAVFAFGPHYSRQIEKQHNYFFYNPDTDLPFELKLAPSTRFVSLSISLESLHRLFTHDALPFLKPENVKTKFYDEREIPSQLCKY